jgi:tetratricopeptide (TPR) repeat protein
MTQLFLSHSSTDDPFVRDLCAALADHGQEGWIDSRQLRGGDPLWPEIEQAIEAATAFAVVVSPAALQSKWVGKELRHALQLREQRGKEQFPVFALALDGTRLGVLEEFFGEEPVYIPLSSEAGGIEAAIDPILVALGKRDPADVAALPQPQAEPLEELVLELTDLKVQERDGLRRATARARLIYEPATPGQPKVYSAQSWRLVAPIGPLEAGDLRWYLEHYAIWPSPYFLSRARQVEEKLVQWGQLLHAAALPLAHSANVMNAWARVGDQAGRRFSVQVDASLEAGALEAGALEAGTAEPGGPGAGAPQAEAAQSEAAKAREAATLLLGLPWELLHNGSSYLFQGAKPTRVRRRLPGTEGFGVAVVAPPIRILLITARPDDEACGYIDHRSSALPLVEATEALPGLVKLHLLSPPTLPALRAELERARDQKRPYHVVHFDGHGVYDPSVGLGGLCFERPEDSGKLEQRRHVTVNSNELGPLLRDHRIPLVCLDACQSAQAGQASESVASALLKVGVASVVAMSHSLLVETSRLFVAAFYGALAQGKRVGDAMLAGQRQLKDDSFRGRIFGAGELRLDDWFVPVLYQEKDDPQLFKSTPAKQTLADFQAVLTARLGELPSIPETGFIGRSRELLALQRLLRQERYAVVRGQGGEGKTALAAELARWLVRSQQIHRAAFVSVETHSHRAAVLDAIGRQLVGPAYSVATYDSLEKATLPVERALVEQATLLVVDNKESLLLPPYIDTSPVLSEEAGRELAAILQLCARLNGKGDTRLLFTSREALPAPFAAGHQLRDLHRLDPNDAVKLVERALNAADGADGAALDAAREQIEQLVEAVHGHARSLALLAPALRSRGVEATRAALVELMVEMEQRFPSSREQSLFASVELSLRRLSPENRERARVLGVFHGGVDLDALRQMMQWEEAEVAALAAELIATGLATPNPYNHLSLNPALCPYLRGRLEAAEREALIARWVEAMGAYVQFLYQQRRQNTEVAATLTGLELPNLFALLDLVQRQEDAEATIDLATSLYSLLSMLGKPRLLERLGQVRDAAAKELERTLGDSWNHARFEATRSRIQQQLAGGQLREALEGAQALFQRARAAGGQAYPGADYDEAMAFWLLGRVLKTAGGADQALPLLIDARQRFEAVAKERPGLGAERMASVCLAEQGDCLYYLGRLDETAAAYEEAIQLHEQRGDARSIALCKGQLGTVRLAQRRYPEALAAHAEARQRFTALDEPGTVAVIWHQTGMVHLASGQPQAAEDAYRQSLAISVRLGDVAGQASTLNQLGNLYKDVLDRSEDAAGFYLQAADKFVESRDVAREGVSRSNLANALRKLRRLDEARQENLRAIECKEQFSHASTPWTSLAILADIETDSGNAAAAAEAKGKAIACYLAYRRDGGENHHPDGRISLAVSQALRSGESAQSATLLQQLAADPEATELLPFIGALQAIVAGSRDPALADQPELDFSMAAEILLLIESLGGDKG